MDDTNIQIITVYRGEDADVPFTPAAATDVSGWTLGFYVSSTPGSAVLTGFPLTTGAGDITLVGGGTTGSFIVSIPSALTAVLTAGARYSWDLWRTDPGHRERLAGGAMTVKEPVRRP